MPCVACRTAQSSEGSLDLSAVRGLSSHWMYGEINDVNCENRQESERKRRRGEKDDGVK